MPSNELSIAVPANSPVGAESAAAAQAELRRMRAALEGWLRFRRINDAAAVGAVMPKPFFRRPGASAPPPKVIAARLQRERSASEGKLAADLYQLLSEVIDPTHLPSPDLARDPDAAVKLAEIAILGHIPGDAQSPSDVGFVWLWPLVIFVGAIAFVITSKIRSDAEEAQERERLQCIKEGHCTDYGFWLKAGSIGVIGWILWDKVGVKNIRIPQARTA